MKYHTDAAGETQMNSEKEYLVVKGYFSLKPDTEENKRFSIVIQLAFN
jgi:hypothetical protein